ncbi:MAG: hypothetical protein HDR15_11060 [Lachnospiraceae bacterium]|nr:hypothetical protein [Lachnospiraceae bacterium]
MDSLRIEALRPKEKSSKKVNMGKREQSEQGDTYFPQESFGYVTGPIKGSSSRERDTSVNLHVDESQPVKLPEPLVAVPQGLHALDAIGEPAGAEMTALDLEIENRGSMEPKKPLQDMNDLLERESVSLDSYLVPEKLKMPGKKVTKEQRQELLGKVAAFNDMLRRIAGNKIRVGPFAVHIVVGDLKGFGDITAGAKLVAELSMFYRKYPEWENVSVKLILHKIRNLSGLEKNNEEIANIQRIAEGIIGGSGAKLSEADDEEGIPLIKLGYPAHNVGGVDLIIQQYGYKQYGDDRRRVYGSGPGYGSLGTIVPPRLQIEQAVAMAEGTTSPKTGETSYVDTLREFCDSEGIGKIHFAYYSIYGEDYKKFIRMMSQREMGILPNTAFVFAGLSLDKLKPLADSLVSSMDTGREVEIRIIGASLARDGESDRIEWYSKTGKRPGSKGKKGSKKAPVAAESDQQGAEGSVTLYMICFDGRLTQPEMMAMYYYSTGEVGATGDQSFIEAYTMRREKAKKAGAREESRAVLYGIPEQQTKLYGQLLEIGDEQHRFVAEQPGFQRIEGNEKLDAMLDEKPLLMPVVMLINEMLLEKYPNTD